MELIFNLLLLLKGKSYIIKTLCAILSVHVRLHRMHNMVKEVFFKFFLVKSV